MILSAQSCLQSNDWICGEYLTSRRDDILAAVQEHVILTVVSVVLGFVLATALALLCRRRAALKTVVLSVTTGIYTIPSLAMFSLLLPYTKFSRATVIIGLALYSLTILVRNILAGLDGVSEEVQEAARGMGFGPGRLLLRVELPLAIPAIMAGLRVATVSTVALATIGAIVGHGGLGNLIYEGLPSLFKAQVFTASVLCVVLAVLADVGLLGVQRLVTPWQRGLR